MPWGGQWWNRFFLLSHFIWLRVVLVAKCWNMQIRFISEFGAMRQLNTISPPRQNPTEAERSETKHRILCSFFLPQPVDENFSKICSLILHKGTTYLIWQACFDLTKVSLSDRFLFIVKLASLQLETLWSPFEDCKIWAGTSGEVIRGSINSNIPSIRFVCTRFPWIQCHFTPLQLMERIW